MNILGEGFDDYVSTQINVRQEKYAAGLSSNKNTEDITFMNSKTSFARLMSSVEVTSGGTNYAYVNGLGLNGLDLAKKYVLFAGTSTSTPGAQRAGLGLDQAYGIGGYELGYRPMPGIDNVDIKTDGDGYTKSATIKIKAYNRQQLEILDVLYMRLGFYMLLEWGNVIYWDNKKNLVSDPYNNSLQDYFFNQSNSSVNKMLEEIRKKRESSCGNYDALFGKVINFSWNYNPDGSFDININLRSVGDIIEGLKMNTQKSVTDKNTKDAASKEKEYYQYKHGISNLYHFVKTNLLGDKYGVFKEPSEGSLTVAGEASFCRVPFEGGSMQYYVKLNRLLAEIQNNYIFILNEDPDEKTIQIDYDVETNLIPANELTISVDPRICIIARNDSIKPKELFPDATEVSENFQWKFYDYLENFIYSEIPDVLYGKLMNIYVNFDYLNRKVDELVDEKTNRVALKPFLNAVLGDISRALGGVNQLEVNITDDNVLRIIDKNPYPKLDELLTKFGKNKTVTKFNVTGYYNLGENKNTTSFVKDLTFQTQIPPEFATIISIGAAAASQVVGEDTTAFSKLSEGLKTRFAEKITESQKEIITSGSITTPDELINASGTYFSYAVQGSGANGLNMKWNEETFESNKNILNSLIKDVNKRKSNEGLPGSTISPTAGFIPVNVSLTMDGLSGMKIFQRFDLDSTFLPSNYPNNIDILIKSIGHKIQNNIWNTTIESVIVGKSSTSSSSTKSSTSSSSSKDSKAASRGYIKQKTQPLGSINANKLRQTVSKLGYTEKGKEINSSGYDISSEIEKAASSVLTTIKKELPSVVVTVTGGNDKYHQGYASRHDIGNAIDFTVSPSTNDVLDKVVNILQRYAAGNSPNFRFIDEYRDKTARATGKHFHISWGAGTEGQAQLNSALALVKDNKIKPIIIT